MKANRFAIVLTAINLLAMLFVLFYARSSDAQPAPAADVLRGRVLELVDDQGQIRSRLNVEPNGEVVFRMTDQSGTIRVKLGAGADGSGMVMMDDETEPAIHMLAKPAGPSVKLTGKDGEQLTLMP